MSQFNTTPPSILRSTVRSIEASAARGSGVSAAARAAVGKRLTDEELALREEAAAADGVATAETQPEGEQAVSTDVASGAEGGESLAASTAPGGGAAVAATTGVSLQAIGLGVLALGGLAAAAGGGGGSKAASPSQPQPSGNDHKLPPVKVPETGNAPINGQGSIPITGLNPGADWEYSLDDGKTWHKGDGSGVSASDLAEGPNKITIVQVDKDGNRSEPVVVEVIKDTIVDKPTLGTSTGTGAITAGGSVTVSGIESGGKWEFSTDGGQTWKPGTGNSISAADLKEGDNTVIVKQTDEAGNVSTSTINVVKDTTIEKPAVGTSTGTGSINGTGSITVSGIEAGGKWEFSTDGGQTWKPGTDNSISAADLKEGDNTVIVKQTDEAGNVSTSTINVVKDTTIEKPAVGTSTGTGSINGTGSITVSGIEAGGKWEFSTDGGQTWKPGTDNSISAADLKEGDNTVIVKQTDEAGNVSTSTINVVKDTTIEKPAVGTSTGTGSINGTGSITVSGIESNGKWEFSTDGGQTWQPGTGNSISAADLKEGDNAVIVKQTDEAGNVSTSTINVVKDTTIEKPAVGTSTGTGSINSSGSITVSGIESNGKWEFSTDGGQTWKPGVGNSISGAELKEGDNTVTIKQTDAAGNVATATITVVKDTLIDKPIVGTSTGTGSINSTGSITVSGIEDKGKWEFSTDGGQTWTPGVGNSISGAELEEGDNTVTIKQTDAAGNVATSTVTVVKDTLIDKPIVGTSTGTGSINNTGSVTVSGIEDKGKWEFSTDGGQTWKPGAGNSISGADLKEGDNTVTIKQTDAAGNVATSTVTVVKDTLIDKPIVGTSTGTGSINSTGSLTVSGIEDKGKWEFSTDGGQTWKPGVGNSISGADLKEGDNTVTIKQTDAAGNVATSTVTVVKDTLIDKPIVGTSTGTGSINNTGSVTVSGIEDKGKWEFSTDGAQTWKPGVGNSISGADLKEGDNTVTIKQTDAAGNVATSTITVVKDTLIDKPIVGTSTGTGSINSTGSITVSGIEDKGKWEFSTDGGQTWKPGTGNAISGADLKEGDNTIDVKQTDAAGNEATSSVIVNKDTKIERPTATPSTGGAIGANGWVNVGALEDNAEWFYSLDNGKTWAQGTGSTIRGSSLRDGDNMITIKQIDVAGNQAMSTTTIKVDLHAIAPDFEFSSGNGSSTITAKEAGSFYLIRSSIASTLPLDQLSNQPSDSYLKLDVADISKPIDMPSLSGMRDGYYRMVFVDSLGNVTTTSTSTGQSVIEVAGGLTRPGQVINGTAGNDQFYPEAGGGYILGGGGDLDFLNLSKGASGVYYMGDKTDVCVNLEAAMGATPNTVKNFVRAGTYNGEHAFLIDMQGQGDFDHPEMVLVTLLTTLYVGVPGWHGGVMIKG